MRCKYLFTRLSVVAILLLGAGAAAAQVGELRGKVFMVQPDGTTVPVVGATIDVFRTDIAGKWETKTDKKGEYVYAGLPYVGTYTIAISAPNARPEVKKGVQVGRGDMPAVTLSAGDGKRFTMEEAKAASASGPPRGGGSESVADKAKREEIVKKNEEIRKSNEKLQEAGKIVTESFGLATAAIRANNYDEAIKQSDIGIAADPEQAALWTLKANALKARAVDRYNAAVLSKDDAAKTAGIEAAKADFKSAAEMADKAVAIAKGEPAATDPAEQTRQTGRKYVALSVRAEAMRLYVTKGDPSQADAGVTAFQEYIAVETDPAKKARAQLDLAQMLLDAGSADKAIVEFQKILDADPDNVDALYGMGVAQINIGYAANDKAKLQEAVNYLQRFVDKAPDTNKYKLEAKATIDEMKKQQNVVPEKTTTPTRRKRP
jgi:tetratricopeptide (TPR) repeat protein